jgi:hypothetical protein
MSRSRIFVIVFLIGGSIGSQSSSTQPTTSLAFSCLGKLFVSVSASTPNHESIPAIGLALSDPVGRTAGFAIKRGDIPDSSYGPVIEIPKLPQRSRALALEICNAEQGLYEIKVTEFGDKPYQLTVRGAGDAKNNSALALYHDSRKGRVRHYRFVFRIEGDQMILKWLDTDGVERLKIEQSEW